MYIGPKERKTHHSTRYHLMMVPGKLILTLGTTGCLATRRQKIDKLMYYIQCFRKANFTKLRKIWTQIELFKRIPKEGLTSVVHSGTDTSLSLLKIVYQIHPCAKFPFHKPVLLPHPGWPRSLSFPVISNWSVPSFRKKFLLLVPKCITWHFALLNVILFSYCSLLGHPISSLHW